MSSSRTYRANTRSENRDLSDRAVFDSEEDGLAASSYPPNFDPKTGNYIPRPPNSFLLFRSANIPLAKEMLARERADKNPTQASVSKVISNWWRALPPHEKQVWDGKAKEAKEEHMMRFPSYQYKPLPSSKSLKAAGKKPSKVKAIARQRIQPVSPSQSPPAPDLQHPRLPHWVHLDDPPTPDLSDPSSVQELDSQQSRLMSPSLLLDGAFEPSSLDESSGLSMFSWDQMRPSNLPFARPGKTCGCGTTVGLQHGTVAQQPIAGPSNFGVGGTIDPRLISQTPQSDDWLYDAMLAEVGASHRVLASRTGSHDNIQDLLFSASMQRPPLPHMPAASSMDDILSSRFSDVDNWFDFNGLNATSDQRQNQHRF